MAAGWVAEISTSAHDPLEKKLEYVVLSVLSYYQGRYEDSLQNWLLSLKLAFPQIEDPECVRRTFKELWEQGVIELKKPSSGYYLSREEIDACFLRDEPFEVRLTAQGVARRSAGRR